jgi:hypothetical protein
VRTGQTDDVIRDRRVERPRMLWSESRM